MNTRVYKFKSLLYGFIIGCIVGGSIVWWQKAYLIDKLIEKGINFFSFNFSKEDNKEFNDSEQNNLKTAKTKYINLNSKEEKVNDINIDAGATVGIANTQIDSITTDTIHTATEFDDNYSVVKEELLYSKSLKVIDIDSKTEVLNSIDTIFIEDDIGDKVVSPVFSIEFWKSPINFKGYKTGKNKIVLYGIYDFKKLSLKKKEEILYLQCDDKYYIIENTNDFKPLFLLANKRTITQLGEK